MNINKILIAFLLILSGCGIGHAQTLHALVACVTDDERIGKGAICNMQNMSNLIQNIAAVLEIEFNGIQFEAKDCTKANVKDWINSIDVEPEDIVFFFYSGHGGRALNDADPFPQMCMNNPARQDLYMPVSHVDSLLAAKNPNLRIIITECCNSEHAGIKVKNLFSMSTDEYTRLSSYDYDALKKLFIDTKGKVEITSSKAKEYSWMTDSGGIFVGNFIDAFNAATKDKTIDPNWNTIFKKAHDETFAKPIYKDGETYYQEPYAEINPEVKRRDVKQRDEYEVGDLFESLQTLVNKKESVENRLAKIPEVKRRHFESNAKVMTIGANGNTVVDYEDVDVFLRRITLSPYITQINVLNGHNNGKNSVIKIHEVRN